MKNVTLTDAKLTAYSAEHILYERQLLWYTATELSRMTKPTPTTSVYLESFAIHLRNLTEFFFTKAGEERNDDIIAADFCPGWRETISPTLDAARVRANKEVSHLTRQRKAGLDPTKPWDTVALFNEISTVARSFATRADAAKLSPEIANWLSSYHKLPIMMVGVVAVTTTNTTATMTMSPPVSVTKGP